MLKTTLCANVSDEQDLNLFTDISFPDNYDIWPKEAALMSHMATLIKIDATDFFLSLFLTGPLLMMRPSRVNVKNDLMQVITSYEEWKFAKTVRDIVLDRFTYRSTLEKIIEKRKKIVQEKKVGILNELPFLFQELERLWHEKIEPSFNIINAILKLLNDNMFHPILSEAKMELGLLDLNLVVILSQIKNARALHVALLNEQKQFTSIYSGPSYQPAWQQNRVTIRIWRPGSFKDDKFYPESPAYNIMLYRKNKTARNIGHASVATGDEYLSLWPPEKFSPATRSLNTLQEDEVAEGPPDHRSRKIADEVIVLFSLNAALIQKEIKDYKKKVVQYKSSGGKKQQAKDSPSKTDDEKNNEIIIANCCDAVVTVIEGEIKKLAPIQDTKLLGISAPTKVLTWLKAAKQEEGKRYFAIKDLEEKTLAPIELQKLGETIKPEISGPMKKHQAVRTVVDHTGYSDYELTFKADCLLQVIREEKYKDVEGYWCSFEGNHGWVRKIQTQPAILRATMNFNTRNKVKSLAQKFLEFNEGTELLVLSKHDDYHYYCRHPKDKKEEGLVYIHHVEWVNVTAKLKRANSFP